MLRIRVATVSDLPRITELIRESFLALTDHYGDETHRSMWEGGVTDAIKADLNDTGFPQTYLTSPASCFWVAETDNAGVIGCVGLKRTNGDEAELVRMAVNSTIRGQGTGGKLVQNLLTHCKNHKICRVLLTTANPQSANFYKKCRFSYAKSFTFPLAVPGLSTVELKVSSMVYYVGAKIIRKVGLTGGTHGNELLGIELIKRWQQRLGSTEPGADELRRSTLQCTPMLSNLPAIAVNRRYVDKDLNRQFKRETLDAILSRVQAGAEGDAEIESEDWSTARLNALLGPKTEFYTQRTGVDFIVDMHSSTSNLGNMLILGCLTHDNLAAHTAHAVQQRLHPGGAEALANGVLRVASTDVTKEVSHWVDSLAPSGLAIEVGPLAHGTMNASLLQDTRRIVLAALDYLEQRNLDILSEARATAAALLAAGAEGDSAADAAAFDFSTATYVPRSLAPVAVVPALVAAAPPGTVNLNYFHMVNPLLFPTAATTAASTSRGPGVAAEEQGFASLPAAVAAKLSAAREKVVGTPAKEAIFHPSMDNRDWEKFSEGAPLFQALDGSNAVQGFSRAEHCPTEKDSDIPLYPVFINEAAYQGNNMACWVVKDAKFTLY